MSAQSNSGRPSTVTNGAAIALSQVARLAPAEFRRRIVALCRDGARLIALLPLAQGDGVDLLAAVAVDRGGYIELLRTALGAARSYEALSSELPQAQAFERELYEDHGITPHGHPWLKPLRKHADLEAAPLREAQGGGSFREGLRSDRPYRSAAGAGHAVGAGAGAADTHGAGGCGDTASAEDASAPGGPLRAHEFFSVAGSDVHEVAVGPVHAGVIEPGHFRFQCHGERVLALEIQLGYQHRGVEALLCGRPGARSLAVAESIAGDSVIAHGWAYCRVLEALSGVEVAASAQALRAVALELERLANHAGDLGALCNDVGYLPGAAWLGRLRGEFLNLLMELSGNRFGRGLLAPGGLRQGAGPSGRRLEFEQRLAVPPQRRRDDRAGDWRADWRLRLSRTRRDLEAVTELIWDTPSVLSRFESTGVVSLATARELGMVGVAARASGCDIDVRRDHPGGASLSAAMPVALAHTGDVLARANVRREEIRASLDFLDGVLAATVADAAESSTAESRTAESRTAERTIAERTIAERTTAEYAAPGHAAAAVNLSAGDRLRAVAATGPEAAARASGRDRSKPGAAIAGDVALRPGHVGVSLIEGWRGEVAHLAVSGDDGEIAAYKVVDPSFHNWFGLAVAMRGNFIFDFPLCNKSFNLSYAGHDL